MVYPVIMPRRSSRSIRYFTIAGVVPISSAMCDTPRRESPERLVKILYSIRVELFVPGVAADREIVALATQQQSFAEHPHIHQRIHAEVENNLVEARRDLTMQHVKRRAVRANTAIIRSQPPSHRANQ